MQPKDILPGYPYRVDYLSADSIQRLHKVNQLRTILHTHSSELKNFGVVTVLAFGSTIKGDARAQSDIDLCFIMDADQTMYEYTVIDEKKTALQNMIIQLFSPISKNFAFQTISQNQKRNDLLHIWIKFTGGKTPRFAQNNIVLWKNDSLENI